MPSITTAIAVQESSQVGEARRQAQAMADSLGFEEGQAGKLSIIVTELATNLVKHTAGVGGEIIIQPIRGEKSTGIEVLSLDRGPGMANLAQNFRDGYSSVGTPGLGLGGIRRLSDDFDAFTQPGHGTALYSLILGQVREALPHGPLRIGGLSLPVHGEQMCGDGWGFEVLEGDRLQISVVDGLGHGPFAHEAAIEALRVVQGHSGEELEPLFRRSNDALRKTRGAALAVLRVEPQSRQIRYVGIGNIASAIVAPGANRSQSLVSMNGIVGHECRKIQEFRYPFEADSVIVMHSDGLGSRWDLSAYPGIYQKPPTLIAGVLYRDFARGRDDVTVVVLQPGRPPAGTYAA